jgi:Phosphotransferase enzyme family
VAGHHRRRPRAHRPHRLAAGVLRQGRRLTGPVPRYVEPEPGAPEEPLLGGDVTEGVVRVGDTVRRPIGPHSAAVQHYLRHLAAAGFDGSPRFLGIDAQGREVLTYVPGEPGGRPLAAWAATEPVLAGIAGMQRRLHDASAGFVLPPGVEWQLPVVLEGVPTAYDAPDIVGQNDMTPDNVIFRDGVPVGLIDFDLSGPTTRLLDIVTTLLYWAPLRAPVDRDPVLREVDAGRRMRAYADAYGLSSAERLLLLDVADRRFTRSWHVMRHHALHRGGGWARMWDEGVGEVIRRGHDWLRAERPALEAALR